MQPPQGASEWFNPSEAQPSDPAQPQMVATPQPVMVGATQPVMIGAAQPTMLAGSPSAFPVQPMMGGGIPTTNATLALILSIISIATGGGICFAIPALFIANGALAVTNQYPGHPDAKTAKAAQVISWIVIGLTALFVVVIILAISISSMAA